MKVRPTRTVELPSQSQVEERLLYMLGAHHKWMEPKALYGPLADHFGLTAAQRQVPRADRHESAWNNLVQQARRRLVNQGWLDGSKRGVWKLTSAGREELLRRENSKVLSLKDLGL